MTNRIIKFRAWHKDYGVFHDIQPSINDCEKFKIGLGFTLDAWFADTQENGFHLMQFTGLHDKNGKEIYEGDVVNFGNYSDNGQACNFVIEYSPSRAMFVMKEIRNFGGKNSQVDPSGAVIGNIYENPELIK